MRRDPRPSRTLLASVALLLSPWLVAAHDHAQDPALCAAEPAPPEIASPVTVPLDAATLGALPREIVGVRQLDAITVVVAP